MSLSVEQVRALLERMEPHPASGTSPADSGKAIAAIRRLLDDLEAGRLRRVVGLSLIQHHAIRGLPVETTFFGLHEVLPDVERRVMARYGDRLPEHLRGLPDAAMTDRASVEPRSTT